MSVVLEPLSGPPLITVGADPLPLEAALAAEVEAIWRAECGRHDPPLYNGALYSLESREGDRFHGRFVEYKWFIAQRVAPELFAALRVRPLAVSGLLRGPEGVVFGQRRRGSTQDAGCWELVPSGGIDRGSLAADGTVDPLSALLAELEEEIGLARSEIHGATPFATVEDLPSHVLDIAIEMMTDAKATDLAALHAGRGSGEYDRIAVVAAEALPAFLAAHEAPPGIVEVSLALLRHRRLI